MYRTDFGLKDSRLSIKPIEWKEEYAIGIGCDENASMMYVGIWTTKKDDNPELSKRIIELFNNNNKPNTMWPYASEYLFKDNDAQELIRSVNEKELLGKITKKVLDIYEKTLDVKELQK